jgi:hypothetical protein
MLPGLLFAGEQPFVTLRDFSSTEMKSAGFTLSAPAQIHIRALGGGGDQEWGHKSESMFAAGWIIDAVTREPVWKMRPENTERKKPDREFDGTISLAAGSYEAYFCAQSFSYHTAFSNININIDHRSKPLFGGSNEGKKGFLNWFTQWWSDDIGKEWAERSRRWGMDLWIEEDGKAEVRQFPVPLAAENVVLSIVRQGDDALATRAFTAAKQVTVHVRALGELSSSEGPFEDAGWIVNADTRERVWEMRKQNARWAGGARKNVEADESVTLPKGTYVVYYQTDDSHSPDDWNDEPPYDPYAWGITLRVEDAADAKLIKPVPYNEFQNTIVEITKVGDNQRRSEGFTLKEDMRLRVYAIGERSNSRRIMADYGTILDAKTREKVWTMDVDRTVHAGGAAKNRMIDEVIDLPKGDYVVNFTTDDSHAYGAWNMDPPRDREHYGITIMGIGPGFSASAVQKLKVQQDKRIIAQIVQVGDDADRKEKFRLDKTTRVRIYAVGEGQNREMVDYGWIEDARSGNVVWEMTYGMTFHAGGGRKNRMVNMTFLLDKGEYVLRYRSDDSHSFDSWNVDPPDDPAYWGITVFREDVANGTGMSKVPPPPPRPPSPSEPDEE